MGLKNVLSDDVNKSINIKYSTMLTSASRGSLSSQKKLASQDLNHERTMKRNNQSRYFDLMAAICSIIALILALIEYEDYSRYHGKPYFTISETGNILRIIILLLTICQIGFLAKYSIIEFRLWNEKNFYKEKMRYTRSPQFKKFLGELALSLIIPYPGLEVNFTVNQASRPYLFNLSGFILAIMLFRALILVRIATEFSKYNSELADIVCFRGGTDADMAFALKSILKEKPYISILSLMIASVILFAIAVRIFERPYYHDVNPQDSSYQEYDEYINSIWLVIISMATIGFGDFVPKTHLGRFTIILSCFWGVFLVSLIVSNLTISSSFINKESKAYDILYRLNLKAAIKEKAAKIVALTVELVSYQKKLAKKKIFPKYYLEKKIKIRLLISQVKEEFRMSISKLPDYEIGVDELLRQLTEKISKDIDEITNLLANINTMEDQINQITAKQLEVSSLLSISVKFSKNLENEIMEFKRRVVDKKK